MKTDSSENTETHAYSLLNYVCPLDSSTARTSISYIAAGWCRPVQLRTQCQLNAKKKKKKKNIHSSEHETCYCRGITLVVAPMAMPTTNACPILTAQLQLFVSFDAKLWNAIYEFWNETRHVRVSGDQAWVPLNILTPQFWFFVAFETKLWYALNELCNEKHRHSHTQNAHTPAIWLK